MNETEQPWKPSSLRKRRIAQEIQRLDDLKAKRELVIKVQTSRHLPVSRPSQFAKVLFAAGIPPKRLRFEDYGSRYKNLFRVVMESMVPRDLPVHINSGPLPRRWEIQRVRRMYAGYAR